MPRTPDICQHRSEVFSEGYRIRRHSRSQSSPAFSDPPQAISPVWVPQLHSTRLGDGNRSCGKPSSSDSTSIWSLVAYRLKQLYDSPTQHIIRTGREPSALLHVSASGTRIRNCVDSL